MFSRLVGILAIGVGLVLPSVATAQTVTSYYFDPRTGITYNATPMTGVVTSYYPQSSSYYSPSGYYSTPGYYYSTPSYYYSQPYYSSYYGSYYTPRSWSPSYYGYSNYYRPWRGWRY